MLCDSPLTLPFVRAEASLEVHAREVKLIEENRSLRSADDEHAPNPRQQVRSSIFRRQSEPLMIRAPKPADDALAFFS